MTGSLQSRIVAFVNGTLLAAGRPRVDEETPLFERGVLDSLQVLDLIAFVEAETGRPLPDSAIRLANFRTATAIAHTALGAAGDSPSRERIWSRNRSGRGIGVAPSTGIEGELLRWGRELGARELDAGGSIPVRVLDRAGYLGSFPGRAVLESADSAIPPAACLRCYAELADRALDPAPVIMAVRCQCARGDETVDAAHGRLREFAMREIVVLGTGAEVDRVRRLLMRRTQTHLTRLDLAATIEVATDPFHVPADRGKLALQRLRALKYELRLPVAGQSVAVASFNHHEDHFGRAFGISLADGSPAHSGCVAFGLERWELAVGAQLGATGPDLARSA